MRIIGDIHGKIMVYSSLISDCEESIQLGDLGFREEHERAMKLVEGTKHKILFGNHDYYPYLYGKHSLGDWYYYDYWKMFCVRGAQSVDQYNRVEGIDWFPQEEMTYNQCNQCMDDYLKYKPNIVISHECPQTLKKELYGYNQRSITNQLLNEMWKRHQPDLWIYGHYHHSSDYLLGTTLFKCLAPAEIFDLEKPLY